MNNLIVDERINALSHDELAAGQLLAEMGAEYELGRVKDCIRRYYNGRAENTIRRYRSGLATFKNFLTQADVRLQSYADADFTNPLIWAFVNRGVMIAYSDWLMSQGYAIGTVLDKLSVLKAHSRVSSNNGAYPVEIYLSMKTVTPLESDKDTPVNRANRDANRDVTRIGKKKVKAVKITDEQAAQMKAVDNGSYIEIRNHLIMCLALNIGLRASELVSIKFDDITERGRTYRLDVYRVKTGKTSHITFDPETATAYRTYLELCYNCSGEIVKPTDRAGYPVLNKAMSVAALGKMVKNLALNKANIKGFSPHDARHYSINKDVRQGIDVYKLQAKYGWTNLVTPQNYIEIFGE